MIDASFTLSDKGVLRAMTKGRAVAVGVLAIAAIVIGFTVTNSPPARILLLVVVGTVAIAAFLSTREHLTITAGNLVYRRASLFGRKAVSAPRSSVLGVRCMTGAGYESVPNFVVSVILEGSDLPSGFPLFDSIDRSRAEGVANQVAHHLAVPVLGVSSRGDGAA